MTRPRYLLALLAAVAAAWCGSFFPGPALAQDDTAEETWLDDFDWDFGGHLKLQGSLGWPDNDSLYAPVGLRPHYDGFVESRLMGTLYFSDWMVLETHYEAVAAGGETRRKGNDLELRYPLLFTDFTEPLDDDQRLVDLTSVVVDQDSYMVSHRLDRLNLTLYPEWGTICLGRQAVTWGHGFLFNPMDLLNPFAPTDVVRDYKIGDDLALARLPMSHWGDIEFVYAPRRNREDRDVKWDHSSVAAKTHIYVDDWDLDIDVMAAKHYEDHVVGAGAVGYLGDTAWRLDATWTFLHERYRGRQGYVSLVANMDYSWIWWDLNWYGYLEFAYSGLSDNEYQQVYTHESIAQRVGRGELHLLGRTYVAAHVDVELHPLVRVYVTTLTNTADPSGTVMPRVVWNADQDLDVTLGAILSWGRSGTEFGGSTIPQTNISTRPVNSLYLLLSWYF